jgi:glycosyltransferase involved in cell wall biosynthesis
MTNQNAIPKPIKCLLIAPADPLTGRLRAGPLRRYSYPPAGVRYKLRTDRFTYPPAGGHYELSPANVSIAVTRFLLEHVVPFPQQRYDLIHSFFWDIRTYKVPWIHETDQSFGQFIGGYSKVKSSIRIKAAELFSTYLNTCKCRGVITWSEWAKRGYVQDGVDRSKVFVIPPSFEQVSDRKPHEGTNMLFIGRDYARKGGQTAVRVYEVLKNEFSNIRLLYVGKVGDNKIAAQMKRDPRIRYLPSVSGSVLEEQIFPVSDLFFLPTRADAFAISVVEAMSRGIPVVASNVCALPEIVENGVSGLLSAPDEVNEFARNITALLGNPPRMRRMGEEARKRVELLFGRERTNRSLRDLYVNALRLRTELRA